MTRWHENPLDHIDKKIPVCVNLRGRLLSACVLDYFRCILAARSQYFEAMLGGPWRESEEDCINLEG